MGDSVAEALEVVKYLRPLAATLETIWRGTPAQCFEALPAVMQQLRMMHTLSRFYAAPDHMIALCQQAHPRMICCKGSPNHLAQTNNLGSYAAS